MVTANVIGIYADNTYFISDPKSGKPKQIEQMPSEGYLTPFVVKILKPSATTVSSQSRVGPTQVGNQQVCSMHYSCRR
jgi:hypothetical protein